MLRRDPGRLLRWLTVVAAVLVGSEGVLAAAPAPPAAPAATLAAPARERLYLFATGGYGASTQDVRRMDLAPYGLGFGIDGGYTMASGLYLGVYFDSWLGRSAPQRRDPRIGRTFDFDADTSALNAGLRIGFDVPLYQLVLRYNLGLGITSMSWDFGDVEASDVLYGDVSHPNVGVHVAPGAALLWPQGPFVVGFGFDYLAQINVTLPSGFLGKVLIGVQL